MTAISKSAAKAAAKNAVGKDLAKMTKAELLGTYYNEARNADIRLAKLEELAKQPGYKTATEWAYARAVKDIENIFGEGRGEPRFDKKIPDSMTKSQIRAAINDVRTFRAAPSSTKTGIDQVYKKRAETINAEYDTGLTWQEIAQILEDGTYAAYDNRYASRTAWKQIKKDFKKELEKKTVEKGSKRVTRAERQQAIEEMRNNMDKYNITIEDLIPKGK